MAPRDAGAPGMRGADVDGEPWWEGFLRLGGRGRGLGCRRGANEAMRAPRVHEEEEGQSENDEQRSEEVRVPPVEARERGERPVPLGGDGSGGRRGGGDARTRAGENPGQADDLNGTDGHWVRG